MTQGTLAEARVTEAQDTQAITQLWQYTSSHVGLGVGGGAAGAGGVVVV